VISGRQDTHLSTNRLHRILIGASTLTRKKKGKIKNLSKVSSSQRCVVTNLSRQRGITYALNSSTVSNTRGSRLAFLLAELDPDALWWLHPLPAICFPEAVVTAVAAVGSDTSSPGDGGQQNLPVAVPGDKERSREALP